MTIFHTVATVDTDWMDDGACRGADTEAFYPHNVDGGQTARRICRGCPVRTQCLEYAISHDERYGIWGGCDPVERRMFTSVAGKVKRAEPNAINTERLVLNPRQRERVDVINDHLACGHDADQIAAAVGISVEALERWIYRFCGQRPPWPVDGRSRGRARMAVDRAKSVMTIHAEGIAAGLTNKQLAASVGKKPSTYIRWVGEARRTLRAHGMRVPA